MSEPVVPSLRPLGTAAPGRRSKQGVVLARETWRLGRTKMGLGLFATLVMLAMFGPLVAPHSATEFVGRPFDGPTSTAKLGTDCLGRDVLSRVLYGGRSVLTLSLAATAIGMVLGAAFGMVAAYSRRWVDELTMRLLDVVMAFPTVVFALLIVSVAGPRPWLIAAAVGIGHAPRVARVARGATLEVLGRDYVLASEALGVVRRRIILVQILPNIASPLLVEASLRLAYSVAIIAALSFLGFGLQPPAADWGLMVNENRIGIAAQPYSVLAPIMLIGTLTIGVSLVADGLSRVIAGIDRRPGE